MKKVIEKKSALKIFYYLMAIDGDISPEELNKFDMMGKEIDSETFLSIKETIIAECNAKIESIAVEDERYDVIQESLDAELDNTVTSISEGVVPRLLVWNMISVAHSDEDYSDAERRLINHVARLLDVDKSILLEMEQYIGAAESVQRKLDYLNDSQKPYAEIRPIVDEMENRKIAITEAVKALIADDILLESIEEAKKKAPLEDAGKKISDVVSPMAEKTGEMAKKTFDGAKKVFNEKAIPAATELKDGAGKLWEKLKDSTKKKTITIPTMYQRINKKLPKEAGVPNEAIVYGMNNGETNALIITYPVDEESAMPFDDTEKIISLLRESLDENAGIIEAGCGATQNGNQYAYDIIKHRFEREGMPPQVEYTLNVNVKFGDVIQFINSSFTEEGVTGTRDAIGFNLFMKVNEYSSGEEAMEHFFADPYDAEYKKGFLMNLSEQEALDEKFPHHPLSEARRLVEFIKAMN